MFAKSNSMARMLEIRRAEVWRRSRSGESTASIAEFFGLSTTTIANDLRTFAKENPRDPEVIEHKREARKLRKARKIFAKYRRGYRYLRVMRHAENSKRKLEEILNYGEDD